MRAIPLVALTLATACSDTGDDSASSTAQTVVTDDGAYTLVLTAEPDPPVAGDATLHMEVTSTDDAPVTGAAITVTPWMTAMDHGVADAPVVIEQGDVDGHYQATWVYSMPGAWDLTIDVDAGAVQDTVKVTYDVQ